METPKQKAIREAYGDHWETVKQHVDENGYLHHPKGGEVTFDPFIGFMDEHINEDAYRPKSLQGLGTNNGWISIESENDLPGNVIDCFVIKDDTLYYPLLFQTHLQQFVTVEGTCYDWQEISHWQEIKEPVKPIY